MCETPSDSPQIIAARITKQGMIVSAVIAALFGVLGVYIGQRDSNSFKEQLQNQSTARSQDLKVVGNLTSELVSLREVVTGSNDLPESLTENMELKSELARKNEILRRAYEGFLSTCYQKGSWKDQGLCFQTQVESIWCEDARAERLRIGLSGGASCAASQ